MQEYTRVMFAELCRLCATKREGRMVNIFDEEGNSLRLQEKMKFLVNIEVSINDNYPKVVCHQCFLKLESAQTFWDMCHSSEVMLNNYYTRAQDQDSFKDFGMVYIPNNELHTRDNAKGELHEYAEYIVKDVQPVEIIKSEEVPRVKLKPKPVTIQSNMITVKNVSQKVLSMKHVSMGNPEHEAPHVLNTVNHVHSQAQVVKALIYQGHDNKINQSSTVSMTRSNTISDIQKPVILNKTLSSPMSAIEHTQSDERLLGTQSETQAATKFVNCKQDKLRACKDCGKVFKRRELLFQHAKIHTGQRPYKCDTCKKAFIRKEHLIRHETTHTGQRDYTCNICSKRFTRNDNLLKHLKIHEKEVMYICEICDKVFVIKHYYDQHMKKVHGTSASGNCDGLSQNFVPQINLKLEDGGCVNEQIEEIEDVIITGY